MNNDLNSDLHNWSVVRSPLLHLPKINHKFLLRHKLEDVIHMRLSIFSICLQNTPCHQHELLKMLSISVPVPAFHLATVYHFAYCIEELSTVIGLYSKSTKFTTFGGSITSTAPSGPLGLFFFFRFSYS